jgi:hypothetical protein
MSDLSRPKDERGEELEDDLTPAERENGETLAELVLNRINAQDDLDKFFEAVPDEQKDAVYNHAMMIVMVETEGRLRPGTVH